MIISRETAKTLLRLLQDKEELNKSEFAGSGKRLADELVQEGILTEKRIGSSMFKVKCSYPSRLSDFLRNRFSIPSLERYIDLMENDEATRAQAVAAAGNSKHKSGKILTGFLVNAIEPIELQMNGEKLMVSPSETYFTFISDYKKCTPPEGTTIVGVESLDCFKYISRQKQLFRNRRCLFVWRYQNSNDIADWLKGLPNPYLHYGDFDLKGIHIYLTEFRTKIGAERCAFLVPEGIGYWLAHRGNRQLFLQQEKSLKNVDFEKYPEVSDLVHQIKTCQRGLEQEFFIDLQ
ncbi:hypothetical protein V9K67_21135 [Paraflavisolibacter sp. H34]|uniref:DUF7281 domain-containing protein n=1 Tax=Huijunlia imazamoxiresistens TaxID=3127457 RepID=UPI0030187718